MTMKSLLIATALVAMAGGGALAQSGNVNSSMPGATSGSKVPAPADQTQQKDKSPGSTDAGAKQEK